MLDTTGLIVEAVGRYLTDQYRRVFGEGGPDHRPAIAAAARLGLERIASRTRSITTSSTP